MTTNRNRQAGYGQRDELRRLQRRQQSVEAIAPPYNRPGLSALAYRVGDYHRFRQKLVTLLSQPVFPGGPTLEALTTRATDDGAIALLDAWAIMADVLTFYQERIANEGFLNTATERLSVLELARSIGYELAPGAAASTYLSFEVEAVSVVADPTVLIPQGTQVESLPGEGELPQLFETVEEVVARPEWSAIAPRAARTQTVTQDTTQLLLSGIDTQLQPGDWVLLIDQQTPALWQLLRLREVTADSETEQTLIRWQPQARINATDIEGQAPNPQRFHQPQLFAFQQQARLFGADAPPWESLPNETKRQAFEAAARQSAEGDPPLLNLLLQGGAFKSTDQGQNWSSLSSGLPDKSVFCLVALPDGTLLAGTGGAGIFRRQGEGSWQAVNEGLTQFAILTLFVENAAVYAGAAGGGLYRSKDKGDTWVAVHLGSVRVSNTDDDHQALVENTALPATVVRTINRLGDFLFAGTDDGLYFEYFDSNGVQSWIRIPRSEDFAVRGLQHRVVAEGAAAILAVGTDKGFFQVGIPTVPLTDTNLATLWQPLGQPLGQSLDTDAAAIATQTLVRLDSSLLAGTTDGLYQLVAETWEKVDDSFSDLIYAIAITRTNTTLLTATSAGLRSWTKQGNDWTLDQLRPPLSNNILTLAVHEDSIYAGSRFVDLPAEVSSAPIASPVPEGSAEGTERAGDAESAIAPKQDWPNFRIQTPDLIDLDTLYPQVVSGSWIALIDTVKQQVKGAIANVTPNDSASSTSPVQTISRKDFGIDTQITRLAISPPLTAPNLFSLRTTEVLAESKQLPLALEPLSVQTRAHQIFQDPIRGKQIFLSQYVAHLQPQQPVLIRGKHLQAVVKSVGGVFVAQQPTASSLQNESQWQAQNTGLTTTDVRSLVTDFCHTESPWNWLYAGTDAGVFRAQYSAADRIATKAGLSWQPLNQGLLNQQVQALVVDSQGGVYAGTADGIFYLADGQVAWESVNQGLWHPNVSALAMHNDVLYAATSVGRNERSPRGVFRLPVADKRWQPTGLTNVDVQTLAIQRSSGDRIGNNIKLLAGTLRAGLFFSNNGGDSWQVMPQWQEGEGVIESDGEQITITQSMTPLAVGDDIRASGQIRTIIRRLDLPEIDREPPARMIYQIDKPFTPDVLANTPFRVGTGLKNPNVTALLFDDEAADGEEPSGGEDSRQPVIFAGTAGSGVFRSTDGGTRWQALREGLTNLEIRCLAKETNETARLWAGTQLGGIFYSDTHGETWIAYRHGLDNTEVKAILPPAVLLDLPEESLDKADDLPDQLMAAGSGILMNREGNYAVPLQLGDVLHVIAPPASEGNASRWLLRDRDGFTGQLITHSSDDLQLLPAAETDPWVSEKADIDYPPEDQRQPILTLTQPLRHSYDPATVTVCANVALATHGETIEETLGNGDGRRSHQQFTLTQPPLTHTAESISPSTALNGSSLQVRVNGVLWKEVSALYRHQDNEPIYFVRLDDDGTPCITFGDGTTGARLPSGLENIIATYRTGTGPEGEVAAEKLILPKTKPLGMVAVNNPLPATGAAPPETLQTARTKAPATLRTLDRIVSLSDFEDFSQGYPGIGKAQARAVWTNNRVQWVHVTIAGLSDVQGLYEPLDETAPLYGQLVSAIDRNRDPIQQVQIDFCEILQFNLAAKVLIDADYNQQTVIDQVKAALRAAFAFEQRAFGQAIAASEVIGAIQSVAGVVAVDIDALYRVGQSKVVREALVAQPARWDNESRQILPAQLLLLSSTGVELEAVEKL